MSSICRVYMSDMSVEGRYDSQHNNIQRNDPQQNEPICDTEHKSTTVLKAECRYAEFRYAECHFFVVLNAIMLSVVAPLKCLYVCGEHFENLNVYS